jgi:YidC/Oxa1 family membrane protein insertase
LQAEDRNRWLVMIAIFAMGMILLQLMMPRPTPSDRGGTAPAQPQSAPGNAATAPQAPPTPAPAHPETDIRGEGEPKVIEVTTDELVVRLTTAGAAIDSLALARFHPEKGSEKLLKLLDSSLVADRLGPRRSMVLREFRQGSEILDFEHWPFKLESDDGGFAGDPPRRTVVFRARQGNAEVVKTFVFRKEGFDIDLGVTVTNRAKGGETFDYKLIGAAGIVADEPSSRWMSVTAKLAGRDSSLDEAASRLGDMEYRTVAAAAAPEEKAEKLILSKNRTEWAALRGRFFAAILAPLDPQSAIAAFAEPLDAGQADKDRRNLAVGVKTKSFTIDPGRPDRRGFLLRAGPQRAEDLEAYAAPGSNGKEQVSREMLSTVNFSWETFARPSRWMLMLLEWSRKLIGSYGWGIVLMTLIVKLCLHPLQRKGTIIMQRNQEKMQTLAPKQKELQEQYKDDPAKLQQATMRLYKEEGFNPAGFALGCLPMMLQMPVWIALYGSITGAFGLRQAPFLWVGDLSRPDTVWHPPFWPHEFNLLPLLYAGLMVVQSFMTPLPADPQQRQQAWMMRFMPLVFFFIIYSMPSAFVLYFAANAILGLSETWLIKKQIAWAKAKAAATATATGAVPASAGAAGKDAPKPAPITDPAAFWTQEGDEKLGKGKKI